MIYLLIFLINGKIDKYELKKSTRAQFKQIGKHKLESSAFKYCMGKASVLTPVLEYAYNLAFRERPDYSKITFMLKKTLLDMNKIPEKSFNWRASTVLHSMNKAREDQ